MEAAKCSNNVFSKKMKKNQPMNGLSGFAGQAVFVLIFVQPEDPVRGHSFFSDSSTA